MKKIIALLMFSILVLFGCSSDTTEMTGGDDVLTIWSHFTGPMEPALAYYEEQTGNETEFVLIPWEDATTKYASALGTSDAPDLFITGRTEVMPWINQGYIVSYDDVPEIAELEGYKTYMETTVPITLNQTIDPATGKNYGIGWEVPATMFYYNTVVAEECFGVSEPEEIEALMETKEEFYEMHTTMQETCPGTSLLTDTVQFFWAGFENSMPTTVNENGEIVVTQEFKDNTEMMKEAYSTVGQEGGFAYTNNDANAEMVAAQNHDALGIIAPSWYTYRPKEFDQPGEWRVANPPFNVGNNGGAYLAMTTNADVDMVAEFYDMTFLNEQYIADNMEDFGYIHGCQGFMDYYYEQGGNGQDEYYGNQDITAKVLEAAEEITEVADPSIYESGLMGVLTTVGNGYFIDGTYATFDEMIDGYEQEVKSLYPEVTVVREYQ